MAKAADIVVQCLENEGVEYVFGIPGEENLDLLESLRTSRKIKLILTRHEQPAGFMAATYGRLTGKTGVCLSTLGPGATNLVTAGAYAYLGGMPMMMITGQKPIKKSKQGRFQILDVCGMMQPLTKYTHQLTSADNIPSRIREAVRLAEEEKPGAVHLELPEDVAAEHTDSTPIPPSLSRRPIAEEKAIRAAVGKLQTARSPILVLGAGANRKMTARVLRQLIEKTGIPFITTQLGKGVVDERHPRFLGNAALSAGDFVHRALEAADLIVNIGHDVIEKPPFFMVRGGTEVIHVNFRSAEVDPVYFPQVEVVGDVANAVWQISEALAPQPHWDFERILAIREANEQQTGEGADDARFPLYPQRVVADVRRVLPSDGIVALDNGIYKIWFARNYKAHMPNTVLLDNALATMGAGLPSAMAARLVHPDTPIIAVCGDGGFMMNSQELETAVRLKLNLVVIILRDDGYGMIRWKQAQMGFEDFGLDYGNPDFVKYAQAYGAQGHRVTSAEGLRPLLEACLAEPGVHVIDCPVDYSENDHLLHVEIRDRAAAV
ncbi:acetolactate synthase large subunit [Pseudomonas typographi]|uniref:Acetolactate synthase large subunit n=1 Tax=Pseudomonas typographi TaxID=2715964 RepID=A0ABR7Z2E4_9PSED|nr:acetolactate synthase large subunit [Pseudomonas typographi]MBD1553548.1 acetolactate synthase large subunit [Pseudomonas typographi]MBD1587305.1 acetolactate synthase large subunit [Pseudomonas typographi]MBD1599622.1 acetolactate synthase large subunit [Pseudomonas typographi]